jgi:hypothetical protein
MKKIKLRTVKVGTLLIETRYQRELDQRRVDAIVKGFDPERVGVPVVSERPGGELVILDGQHRLNAMLQLDLENEEIVVEVRSGLSLTEEATHFLKLNDGRCKVGAFDKYRAELIARRPAALEIEAIVKGLGLRVARGKGIRCICAIDAVRSVHLRQKNLHDTLLVLKKWASDDPSVFDRDLLKAVSAFLDTYPKAMPSRLVAKLTDKAPDSIQRRIQRQTSKADGISSKAASCVVLREVYNDHAKKGERLPPLHVIAEQAEEAAA